MLYSVFLMNELEWGNSHYSEIVVDSSDYECWNAIHKLPHTKLIFEVPNSSGKPLRGIPLIYVIKQRDYIKIGRTTDLLKRYFTLNTGSPENCDVLAIIVCDTVESSKKLERKLHKQFSSYNYNREWFHIECYEKLRSEYINE